MSQHQACCCRARMEKKTSPILSLNLFHLSYSLSSRVPSRGQIVSKKLLYQETGCRADLPHGHDYYCFSTKAEPSRCDVQARVRSFCFAETMNATILPFGCSGFPVCRYFSAIKPSLHNVGKTGTIVRMAKDHAAFVDEYGVRHPLGGTLAITYWRQILIF